MFSPRIPIIYLNERFKFCLEAEGTWIKNRDIEYSFADCGLKKVVYM